MDNLNPQQFQPELEGVDWGSFFKPVSQYDKEDHVLTQYKNEFGRLPQRVISLGESDTKDPTRSSGRKEDGVRLQGLHSDRMFYNENQQQGEARGLGKLQKIAERHPLPPEYTLAHSSVQVSDGSQHHDIHIRNQRTGVTEGKVSWNGDTGHVAWLGVENPELRKLLTPHLVLAAHQKAQELGETGPTHAKDLSDYSYRTVKRMAPEFIPEDASVGVTPIADYEKRLERQRNQRAVDQL